MVKSLPPAATRPVPMHARPTRESLANSGEMVLAHSGAGVVSSIRGATAHARHVPPTPKNSAAEVGAHRPVSAGNLRRVETAPTSLHQARAAARPGSAKPAMLANVTGWNQPNKPSLHITNVARAKSGSPDNSSPQSRARRLLLEESTVENVQDQELQWAETSRRLKLGAV